MLGVVSAIVPAEATVQAKVSDALLVPSSTVTVTLNEPMEEAAELIVPEIRPMPVLIDKPDGRPLAA